MLFIAVGIWAYTEKERFDVGGAKNIYDILFDISIVIIVIGSVIFVIGFTGCLGALRENIVLLKIVSVVIIITKSWGYRVQSKRKKSMHIKFCNVLL